MSEIAPEPRFRVLHVLSERGFSGGENQLAAIVRHLHARGHEQHFVLQPEARFAGLVHEIGAPLRELRMANDVDLRAASRLRRLFRREHADVISYACARGHKLGALAALGLRDLPPRMITRRMDYPLRGWHKRWLYRDAVQQVVVISRAVQDCVRRLGVPDERIALIHEGVPCRELAALRTPGQRTAAREALGLPEGVLVGATLASLHERKGIDVLIEALAALPLPAGCRLVWCVGGDGPLRDELAAHARARARPECELLLLGQVDARRLLAAAELFCLPSRLEGLGVALLEAMAAGLPAVASRVGGMQDSLVEGETGLFAEPGDALSLRHALSRLASDAALRLRLGAAAMARAAAHFDVEHMCRATEAVYAALARGAREAREARRGQRARRTSSEA